MNGAGSNILAQSNPEISSRGLPSPMSGSSPSALQAQMDASVDRVKPRLWALAVEAQLFDAPVGPGGSR